MTINKRDKRAEIVRYIEQHKALIYKVVNSYCSDTHEQEDLIQDVILQLIISYDTFDHKVKVTTWMYRVALNVSISHYRKIQTRKEHISSMPEQLIEVEDISAKETSEDVIRLRTFIQELAPLDRGLFIMYLDGSTHAEISEAIGISVSYVGTKIERIKKQLKEKIKKQ